MKKIQTINCKIYGKRFLVTYVSYPGVVRVVNIWYTGEALPADTLELVLQEAVRLIKEKLVSKLKIERESIKSL